MFSKPTLRAKYAVDKFIQVAMKLNVGGDFLDIGAGDRSHTVYIENSNVFKNCFSIDSYPHAQADKHLLADFEMYDFDKKFDAILASHVLEHTLNVGSFLKKIHAVLEEDGIFCIIVPPAKSDITCGHVTTWNAGLLLLNCVKAGFDCRNIMIKKEGYNIAIIGQKKSCNASFGFEPDKIGNERFYLPKKLSWYHKKSNDVWYFKGDIKSLNW